MCCVEIKQEASIGLTTPFPSVPYSPVGYVTRRHISSTRRTSGSSSYAEVDILTFQPRIVMDKRLVATLVMPNWRLHYSSPSGGYRGRIRVHRMLFGQRARAHALSDLPRTLSYFCSLSLMIHVTGGDARVKTGYLPILSQTYFFSSPYT